MARKAQPKRRGLHTTLNPHAYALLERLAENKPLGALLDELIAAEAKRKGLVRIYATTK